MTDYKYKSDFRSLYFSHVHIFDINYIVNHKLRGSWNIKPDLFIKYHEKPTNYTICVHDEYKNEYWIYDEEKCGSLMNLSELKENLNTLKEFVHKYASDNYTIFNKCLHQNKLEFLTRLNRYDVILFKDVYIKYSMNFDIDNELSKKFIDILDEMIEKNINNNIGTFINTNHNIWIHELLKNYSMHHLKEYDFIDMINTLLFK
jgi:hypothetical protein